MMTQLDMAVHKDMWQVTQRSAMLDDPCRSSRTISALIARAHSRLDS